MLINWFLNSQTQQCEWTINDGAIRFQMMQTIEEFFKLVDLLHEICVQLRQNMANGMDPVAAIAEAERLMAEKRKDMGVVDQTNELKNDAGFVIAFTDRIYQVEGDSVTFDELIFPKGSSTVLQQGQRLQYNGKWLILERVDNFVGLLIDAKGARGPVCKGVHCKVEMQNV